MKHIKEFPLNEDRNHRKMILVDNRGQNIEVQLQGSKILEITNNTQIRFPFSVNSNWNRSIETWACNNRFKSIETWIDNRKVNEEDPCPEQKIFGVRTKDVPMGHEWRLIYPNKFRR